MARINGNILGNISGKIGNLSARTRNGVTYLSARPSSFNESDDPSYIKRKKKFAVAVSISSLLIRDKYIKNIWKNIKNGKSSAFNNIIGVNSRLCLPEMPSINNRITPDGFHLPVDSVVLNSDRLLLNISGMDKYIEFLDEENIMGIKAMICVYDPKDTIIDNGGGDPGPINTDQVTQSTAVAVMETVDEIDTVNPTASFDNTISSEAEKVILPYYDLFMLSHEVINFDKSGLNSFEIIYNNYQKQKLAEYNSVFIYMTAITQNSDGKIMNYSSTYASKMPSPVNNL